MASPAGPNLTAEQYRLILEVLSNNPTVENRPIREEIAGSLASREYWTADARRKSLASPY